MEVLQVHEEHEHERDERDPAERERARREGRGARVVPVEGASEERERDAEEHLAHVEVREERDAASERFEHEASMASQG